MLDRWLDDGWRNDDWRGRDRRGESGPGGGRLAGLDVECREACLEPRDVPVRRVDAAQGLDCPACADLVFLIERLARLGDEAGDPLRARAGRELLLEGQRVGGIRRQRQRLGQERLGLVQPVLLQGLPRP